MPGSDCTRKWVGNHAKGTGRVADGEEQAAGACIEGSGGVQVLDLRFSI